jgi:hypothetical protein
LFPSVLRRILAWLPEDESRPIQYLMNLATRPEFNCRVRWEPGTLTMGQIPARLLHTAINDYSGYRRVITAPRSKAGRQAAPGARSRRGKRPPTAPLCAGVNVKLRWRYLPYMTQCLRELSPRINGTARCPLTDSQRIC